ncbi:MAG TPA: CehA/McbA family metallohydrolase [Byssovorax sp.]
MFTQRVFAFGIALVGVTCVALGVSRRSSAAGTALLRWPRPAAALQPPAAPLRFVDDVDVTRFLRGNVHTHTRNSDGDSTPDVVYAWYRDHGYQWLAITDHNTRTNPATYKSLARAGKFVMIPAEEVTMHGAGKQVHVNALCTKKTVGGHRDATQAGALAWAVAAIHAQGAVALVNHPNWDWALRPGDLEGARGAEMLEVASGHPYVHEEGDAEHPSHEAMWTAALDAGLGLGGAAVDDAHDFAESAKKKPARPGRGWIQAFADAATPLDAATVCGALAKHRYYFSSGPALTRVTVHGSAMTVWPVDPGATVEFVGEGGAVLKAVGAAGDGARYDLRGDERYVRARVTDPGGKKAWTNAYATTR